MRRQHQCHRVKDNFESQDSWTTRGDVRFDVNTYTCWADEDREFSHTHLHIGHSGQDVNNVEITRFPDFVALSFGRSSGAVVYLRPAAYDKLIEAIESEQRAHAHDDEEEDE